MIFLTFGCWLLSEKFRNYPKDIMLPDSGGAAPQHVQHPPARTPIAWTWMVGHSSFGQVSLGQLPTTWLSH